MLLAEASSSTNFLIALIGSGGVVGGIVALLKLRGDANSAAVEQAQGAMEVMQILNQTMEIELSHKNEALERAREENARLEEELVQCRAMVRHLSVTKDDP
jgi:hypothetical protein